MYPKAILDSTLFKPLGKHCDVTKVYLNWLMGSVGIPGSHTDCMTNMSSDYGNVKYAFE